MSTLLQAEPMKRNWKLCSTMPTRNHWNKWALPSNDLAASYLERDTVDTSILEPLDPDLSIHSTDYSRMNADGSRTEMDKAAGSGDQPTVVYIKKGDFASTPAYW